MSVVTPYFPSFVPRYTPTLNNRVGVGPYGVSASPAVPWGAGVSGNAYGVPQSQQNYSQPFYSDYAYYWSPYQHPMMVHQASAAANNWFLDAVSKVAWHQVVPSWVEMARMGVRSAQDVAMARFSRWRSQRPGEDPWRGASEQILEGLRHWA